MFALAQITSWCLNAEKATLTAELTIQLSPQLGAGAPLYTSATVLFSAAAAQQLLAIRAATQQAITDAGGPIIQPTDLRIIGAI